MSLMAEARALAVEVGTKEDDAAWEISLRMRINEGPVPDYWVAGYETIEDSAPCTTGTGAFAEVALSDLIEALKTRLRVGPPS